MAEKLVKMYKFVKTEKGAAGAIALAKKTKVPSTMAAMEPDTPERIKQFKEIIKDITGKIPPV